MDKIEIDSDMVLLLSLLLFAQPDLSSLNDKQAEKVHDLIEKIERRINGDNKHG